MFLADLWLTLSPPEAILALAALYAGTGVFIHWLSFAASAGQILQRCRGIAPPFAGIPTAMFALFVGFLGNDVWTQHRLASEAVMSERDALLNLRDFCLVFTPCPELDQAVHDYAKAAIEKDWPAMAAQKGSEEAAAALHALVTRAAHVNDGEALKRSIIDAATKVRLARAERLTLGATFTHGAKWLTALALGVVAQIGVALVHLDNRRAQAAAMIVFSLGAILMIGPVALFEGPFIPPFNVGPEPLAEVLKPIAGAAAPPASPQALEH